MYPQAASVLYASFILAAIAIGGALTALRLRGLFERRCDAVWLVASVALLGLAGGKLFSVLERGGFAWHVPWWEVTHGYRYPGAILAIAAGVPVLTQGASVSLLSLGDAMAAPTAAAMAIVRLGCWSAGCCHGTPTSLPWGVRFPHGSAPWQAHLQRGWLSAAAADSLAVHPLQLYFAATSLALAVFLLWLGRRPLPRGRILFVFLTVDGLIKLGLEQLRLETQMMLQLSALIFLLAGLAGLARTRSPGSSVSRGGSRLPGRLTL